uniref:Anoctamin n=1 Tax=Ciona savignyi TaxID=51511 RepID=H2YH03_CIOSA
LLHGAEAIGLKKEYKDGSIREFCFTDRYNFTNQEDDDFLLESEKHQIIKVELDSLRALDEKYVPGHQSIKLYPGKSICKSCNITNFRRLASNELITDFFPLHDRPALHKLRWAWYKTIDLNLRQPLDRVRAYFGDTIGIYFAFLNFYTIALVPLVMLGLMHWGLGLRTDIGGKVDDNWVLSVIHVLWSAAFLEMWKRKSTEYSYKWGTLGTKVWEEPRTGFRGPLGLNEVTQRQEPAFYDFAQAMQFTFRKITLAENHRLESDFQKNLITKILVFDFANNFLALFYIAFIYDDMPMLRQTLRNLFLVHMIVSQALESLLPYWTFRYRSSLYRATLKSNRVNTASSATDTGTFDDYLELWLQFGYVVLFSCVYPPAAIFALINNVIEMKSDAFKMCNVYRRPFVYQTNGIGTWKHILLGVRWLISYAVPVVPHWVKVETQRMKYFSLQALKRQV